LANLVILWIIAVVVALNRERLHQLSPTLLIALVAINVGGYLAGYGGGRLMRLPSAMRRALTLEIGMQNAGLGAVLSRSLFPDDPAVAIAPAMYTFGCMLTGTVLARFWAMSAARDDRSEAESDALAAPIVSSAGEAE
jgi:BASS family bile acid:Na+ symporter